MTTELQSPGPSKVAAAFVTVAGLVLAWMVVTKSGAAYLAQNAPEKALRLNANDPVALVALAKWNLKPRSEPSNVTATGPGQPASPPGRLPTIAEIAADAASAVPKSVNPVSREKLDAAKALATSALRIDPLNARALSTLGQVALRDNDDAKATALMTAARRLTPREWPAVLWLMQTSLDKHDYAKAMEHADTLLRTRAEMGRVVGPMLVRAAEDKASNQHVKDLLATDPPWRGRFFLNASKSISDARTPLDLLLHLKDTPHPPSNKEIEPYLDFLFARKFYDIAYYTWLQFLPPEQLSATGAVFNGSFENKPSGSPFDWNLPPGTGVTTAVESRADNEPGHVLAVAFTQGRAVFQPVTQTLLLSPGDYTFAVQHKGKINSTRGLIWRVVCNNKPNSPIGESSQVTGTIKEWSPITFAFSVPEADGECPLQTLKLEFDARSASEQFISGSMSFDDVTVTPHRSAPAASAPAQTQPTP